MLVLLRDRGTGLQALNYYSRHLGDYAKDTGQLSMTEHGAYTLLLDWYYANERPIPAEKIYRIAKATTPEERESVDAVLADFFLKKGREFFHKRVDEEIARFNEKSDKASASARQRWEKNLRPHSERNANGYANASETHSERNATRARVHKPITNNQEKALEAEAPNGAFVLTAGEDAPKGSANTCPHQEIVALYHELLPALPAVRLWTAKRAGYKHLQSRWREVRERQSLKWWEAYFRYVSRCDFLMGKTNGARGPFYADLDWLVNATNLVKVYEGKYQNANGSART